jgi:hypothetical protein
VPSRRMRSMRASRFVKKFFFRFCSDKFLLKAFGTPQFGKVPPGADDAGPDRTDRRYWRWHGRDERITDHDE